MSGERQTIALMCPAERDVIGSITGKPGQVVNKHLLKRGFSPASADISASVFWEKYRNGAMLLCPRCGNPLVCGVEGQSTEAAVRDDLRVVLGFFRMPMRVSDSGRARYTPTEGTPDPARQAEAVEVVDSDE